jgi:hypothetical protein
MTESTAPASETDYLGRVIFVGDSQTAALLYRIAARLQLNHGVRYTAFRYIDQSGPMPSYIGERARLVVYCAQSHPNIQRAVEALCSGDGSKAIPLVISQRDENEAVENILSALQHFGG